MKTDSTEHKVRVKVYKHQDEHRIVVNKYIFSRKKHLASWGTSVFEMISNGEFFSWNMRITWTWGSLVSSWLIGNHLNFVFLSGDSGFLFFLKSIWQRKVWNSLQVFQRSRINRLIIIQRRIIAYLMSGARGSSCWFWRTTDKSLLLELWQRIGEFIQVVFVL